MKLKSIQVSNFRSIENTQPLELEDEMTVILGPNNEGKSNLLRAIALGLRCLRWHTMRKGDSLSLRDIMMFRRDVYDWEIDFPQNLQGKSPNGETVLNLVFMLTDDECTKFKKQCGCATNANLPIEVKVGLNGYSIKVKKQGKGANNYKEKSSEIAKFIGSNFDFQYIEAIRTEEQSLEVVGRLIERRLQLVESTPEYISAIKVIEGLQKPIIEGLENEVKAQLKRLLPSVKKVKLGTEKAGSQSPIISSRGRLRSAQLVIDDGTATGIEAKGDGIKSLVAISLMHASRVGSLAGNNLVVAIEEPESHLHPGAVRELSAVLDEISKEHQVIITTHSPLLISKGKIGSNIIVSKSRASPASSIKDIRSCLGVHVSDNLMHAEHIILVEGKTDQAILTALFKSRSKEFSQLISSGKIVFDQIDGTGNIAYKVATLKQIVSNPILILDDDSAGRLCVKKAKETGFVSDKYVYVWKRDAVVGTELEDIIDPDVYWSKAEADLGVKLSRKNFDGYNEKWSDRMKKVYQAGAKSWSASVENDFKRLVADCVSSSPDSALGKEYYELLDNMIAAILGLVKS